MDYTISITTRVGVLLIICFLISYSYLNAQNEPSKPVACEPALSVFNAIQAADRYDQLKKYLDKDMHEFYLRYKTSETRNRRVRYDQLKEFELEEYAVDNRNVIIKADIIEFSEEGRQQQYEKTDMDKELAYFFNKKKDCWLLKNVVDARSVILPLLQNYSESDRFLTDVQFSYGGNEHTMRSAVAYQREPGKITIDFYPFEPDADQLKKLALGESLKNKEGDYDYPHVSLNLSVNEEDSDEWAMIFRNFSNGGSPVTISKSENIFTDTVIKDGTLILNSREEVYLGDDTSSWKIENLRIPVYKQGL